MQALPADGLAVLNADDDAVPRWPTSPAPGSCLVGEADDADVRATDVSLDAGGRADLHRHRAAGHPDA